jgi:hypothetical protein
LFKRLPLSLFIAKETGRKKERSTVFRFLEMGDEVCYGGQNTCIKERKDKVREEKI